MSKASPNPTRRGLFWGVALAAVGAGALLSWRREEPVAGATAGGTAAGTGTGGGAPTAAAGPGGTPDPASISDAQRLADDFWLRAIEKPDGQPLGQAAWRGRPLLLNFWATWCPPCLREMPMLDQAWQQWSPKGLVVLGLAVDSPTPVRAYLDKTRVGFPIGMAGAFGSELGRQLGNAMGGLPYSVLVDGDGRILERHTGELTAADVQKWVARVGLKG